MTRVTSCVLLAVLGLALSGPAAAHTRDKYPQTKAQKDAAKQSRKYNKKMAKQQKKQMKAQQKANKKFNKSHPTITVT